MVVWYTRDMAAKNAHTVDISGREHLEEWRIIPRHSDYEASNLGRVRKGSRIITQRLHYTRRYPVVEICGGGKHAETLVHRLVLMAFAGDPPEGTECRHLNGIRTDNRIENLAWGTHSENSVDQVRHGTHRNISKTHCIRGHEFTPENTFIRGENYRTCRECKRMMERLGHKRRRAQKAAQKAS